MVKEKVDSQDSKIADFYQILVAIYFAFNEKSLNNFDNLTIERFGDVSFDSQYQIECKHHKTKPSLGDTHEDFWKTIYNWLTTSQEFDNYILFTTSKFPAKSSLKSWNKLAVEERISVLEKINFGIDLNSISNYKITDKNIEILKNKGINNELLNSLKNLKKEYNAIDFIKEIDKLSLSDSEKVIVKFECKDTSADKYKVFNFSRIVLSYEENKLKRIISKIKIVENQKVYEDLLDEICDSSHAQFLSCKTKEDKKNLINDKLAGTIYSKVRNIDKWTVTRSQFYEIIQQANSLYCKDEYRPIFDELLNKNPEKNEIDYSEKNFLTQLKNIECDKDEIDEAIVDYWKTNKLLFVTSEKDPSFIINEYNPYKENIILKTMKNERRLYKSGKIDSLNFYRKIKTHEFINHKSIKSYPYFTHGTMHNIVEDNQMSWIL